MNENDPYFDNVREVSVRLDQAYEQSQLGNKDDPFEELVYIVLATRTDEDDYQRTFERVKNLVGEWNRLPDVPVDELEAVIGEAGLARKKAQTLMRTATKLRDEVGEVSLDILGDMDTREAEDFLLEFYGVGPKTAKCVLMYSLDRLVFPVDTHCVRVGNRLGWLDTEARRFTKAQMHRIEERVPGDLRKSLHIRLVQHGRVVCVAGKPRCAECPLTDLCDYFATSAAE